MTLLRVVLVFVTFLHAPILADVSVPSTVSVAADKGVVVTIRNTGSQPLTALLIITRQFDQQGTLRAEHFRYMDAEVQPLADRPIAPGETREIGVLAQTAPTPNMRTESHLAAVLFANGTAEGESAATTLLKESRRTFLRDLRAGRQLLADTSATATERQQYLSRCNAWLNERKQIKLQTRHEQFLVAIGTLVPTWFVRHFETSLCTDAKCLREEAAALMLQTDRWKLTLPE